MVATAEEQVFELNWEHSASDSWPVTLFIALIGCVQVLAEVVWYAPADATTLSREGRSLPEPTLFQASQTCRSSFKCQELATNSLLRHVSLPWKGLCHIIHHVCEKLIISCCSVWLTPHSPTTPFPLTPSSKSYYWLIGEMSAMINIFSLDKRIFSPFVPVKNDQ